MPPRLALIASLVPPGARIADVGTDHGRLPVWLLEQGIAVSAVATDIRPGPLSRAESLRRERGLSAMRCVLCDGLEEVSPAEADTVVIAGMGGENIAEILRRAPWTALGTLLLLQPMSRPEELRRALPGLGLTVIGEHLVQDGGKLYPVLTVRGGTEEPCSEAELYTGRYSLVCREPLFFSLLNGLEKKLDAALTGLRRSEKEPDAVRRERLSRVREQLTEMRRRAYAEGIGDRGLSGEEGPLGPEGGL